MLDLVPPERRIAGEGASWAMAPFTHTSTDRPSRFTDGSFGVYYAGDRIEVALFETMHHHGNFMASTAQEPGWVSDFRELIGRLDADLHDISNSPQSEDVYGAVYDGADYAISQKLAARLRDQASSGILYKSVRYPEGLAVALFWPDVAGIPTQGQHFSYYWDGEAVSKVRNLNTGDVFSVIE